MGDFFRMDYRLIQRLVFFQHNIIFGNQNVDQISFFYREFSLQDDPGKILFNPVRFQIGKKTEMSAVDPENRYIVFCEISACSEHTAVASDHNPEIYFIRSAGNERLNISEVINIDHLRLCEHFNIVLLEK